MDTPKSWGNLIILVGASCDVRTVQMVSDIAANRDSADLPRPQRPLVNCSVEYDMTAVQSILRVGVKV